VDEIMEMSSPQKILDILTTRGITADGGASLSAASAPGAASGHRAADATDGRDFMDQANRP